MGVPKFFRYISERYPCLSETVKDYQIPEFDNLYLDMNGIIHICSHPDDGDPHFRITEEKILQDIFHYIEVLFRMIKPRKLFFMAVDGVAPRAKMNQQRGRRFRSAKEALTLESKARERGEVLPTEERFDSNCITPGTIFMVRLQEQLKYFVVNKISTDKLWQSCKIVLSGQETPGEGEHKVMDFIRYMRAQPGYDPNTRHCLYGLDADLIMLGLCTHEPHFSLLREEVKFGKKSNKRKNIPEQITFFLLHLSLMREYLELEFQPLKANLTFEYDMEKIVDDWVLMGFLVGNDFIPNLPNMHISNGALPLLYSAYMKVLPTLGGYINEGGILNLERFEIFIRELGNIDLEHFSEICADLKWFEAKTGRRMDDQSKAPARLRRLEPWESETEVEDLLNQPLEPRKENSDLAALIKATNDILLEPSTLDGIYQMELQPEADSEVSETEDDDLFNAEFLQHKTDYYMNKLEYQNVTPEVLRAQAEEYVRAIQWNLHYYYNGVCSWSWFYPHHYAPYVSDIKGFSGLKFNFELGTPFKPYEQLLAVLPSASKLLLPAPYHELMVNDDSLIKSCYPEDFKTDLNGKKQEWEAVVLIPFIDEEVLLNAMKPCNAQLTIEEIERNQHGPMLVYKYSPKNNGIYEAPQYFPPVTNSHALCQLVSIDDIRVPIHKLVKGAYPGAKFDVYYPGFPTLKHLKYTGHLEKRKVRVFEQPSRGDNMIITISEPVIEEENQEPTIEGIAEDLDDVAKQLLGNTVHVGWPHLVEAKVIAVSNTQYKYNSAGEKGQYNVEENKGSSAATWKSLKQGIVERYQNRLGIDVGTVNVLVHVKVMIGRKYVFSPQGRITLEKQWASVPSVYPLQSIVRNIAVYESEFTAYQDMDQVFPVGSRCFMLGQPCYGSVAEVLENPQTTKDGRVKINLKKYEEPVLKPVINLESDLRVRYMNLHVAASKLAISKGLFSRITGSIFITPGGRTHLSTDDMPKTNIGLSLKFNKKNQEVPGYSRRENFTWLYSDKTIALVNAYMEKFPKVFEYINRHFNHDVYFEEELFDDGNSKEILKQITTWIKAQPFYSIERQMCENHVLDPETITTLENVIDEYKAKAAKPKQMIIKVKPHLLFKPDLQMGNLMPDSAAVFQLFDRIVNIREGYTVPLGFKGTVVGIYQSATSNEDEVLYDVVFDQPFLGGLAINCSDNRGYRMPKPAIINISHGQRVYEQKTGKPGQFAATNQSNQNPSYPNSPSAPTQQQQRISSQFQPQPPVFASWQQGCNFQVRPPIPPPPAQGFNYNNFTPNFNNSHPPPNPYNAGYFSPPSYNNVGPNTFVPYKSNNFPQPPSVPTNYGQKNGTNSRSHSGDVRGVQKIQNGGQWHEKEDSRNVMTRVFVSKNAAQTENVQNLVSTTNSDVLKKMLKINENPSISSDNNKVKPLEVVDKKINSTSSSVDDFFARARVNNSNINKDQASSQSTFSTAKLLREYQIRKLGCPNYQYFELDKKFMSKVTLPNGSVVDGEFKATKEEAAESVATKALLFFQDNSRNAKPMNTKLPLDVVPEPTRKWQNVTQSSPQKSGARLRGNNPVQENWRTENRHSASTEDDSRRMLKINTEHIYKHLNVQQSSNMTRSHREVKPNPQNKNNSTFVPLQAVRQQRIRTNSTNSSENVSKENTSMQSSSTMENKPAVVGLLKPEGGTYSGNTEKPRRERKVRIAANFQTAMSK